MQPQRWERKGPNVEDSAFTRAKRSWQLYQPRADVLPTLPISRWDIPRRDKPSSDGYSCRPYPSPGELMPIGGPPRVPFRSGERARFFFVPFASSALGWPGWVGLLSCWRERDSVFFSTHGTTTIADHMDRVVKDGAHTRWDVISPIRTLDAEYPPASERRRETQRETDRQCQHWAVDQDVFLGIAGRCLAQGGGERGMGVPQLGRGPCCQWPAVDLPHPQHLRRSASWKACSRGCSQRSVMKNKTSAVTDTPLPCSNRKG